MAAPLPAERLSVATPVASRAERLATLAVTSLVPVVTLHLEMPKVAMGVPLAMVVMHTAVPLAMLTEVMFSTAMENSSAEAVLAVVPPVVVLVPVAVVRVVCGPAAHPRRRARHRDGDVGAVHHRVCAGAASGGVCGL